LSYDIQHGVAEFHKKFGHPVRDGLSIPEETEGRMALEFIHEEVWELQEALIHSEFVECGEPACCSEYRETYDPDLIEVADALGDIVFVAYGMALRFGIDLDRVLAAIVESNMTKEPNGQGKIKKGEDYVPPKIAEALGFTPESELTQEGFFAIPGLTEGKLAA
jgi:predicted HAD superfamily Cof-like phosphohydrolase